MLSSAVRKVEGAMKDICFPLHNYIRYNGSTDIIKYFDEIVQNVGSNQMKISGKKVYLVKSSPKDVYSTETHLSQSIQKSNADAEPDRKLSKAQQFFNSLKGLMENFRNDDESKLEGKFRILNQREKLWPLSEVFTLRAFFGLHFASTFPMHSIRNYFGPNVALYFFFTAFFINRLLIIGVVGLLVYLVASTLGLLIEYVFEGNQDPADPDFDLHSWVSLGRDLILWLFSIYVFVWGFRFTRDWEVHEKLFQINNGDVESNEGNQKDAERINVRNYFYTRSLITDEMNTKSNQISRMNMRFMLVVAVTFVMGLICMGVSIQILEGKQFLIKHFNPENVFYLSQQIGGSNQATWSSSSRS